MQVKIEKLTESQIEEKKIRKWSIWEKEISDFEWYYDSMEQCLFLEGEVTVKTYEGDYHIKKGDFVTFNKGLACTWQVKKAVKKHYKFY
ncbi:MAG: cupin domain-containing protein [Bacteroidia bacterium]|nr:cupin domain-containing protein [Bacteroidia bacterium]